jgi:predicted nucleotidyltransferase
LIRPLASLLPRGPKSPAVGVSTRLSTSLFGPMLNFLMHPLIENNREAIARLCRVHGVRSLEAFGSILRDDFDVGRSDVDVLVEFEAQAADSFSNFLDLKESLEALFQRSVDLVELRAIRNRRLRYYIEQSKSSIYAAA